jgi:hypothetical protein
MVFMGSCPPLLHGPFRDRLRRSEEIVGKAVALRGVEDRKSFEERDGDGLVAHLA